MIKLDRRFDELVVEQKSQKGNYVHSSPGKYSLQPSSTTSFQLSHCNQEAINKYLFPFQCCKIFLPPSNIIEKLGIPKVSLLTFCISSFLYTVFRETQMQITQTDLENKTDLETLKDLLMQPAV